MRALVKEKAEIGLCIRDIPLPQIRDNEVLIKIKKSAICGTDIHIYEWNSWAQRTIPIPMPIGHEFVGIIVEIGSAVTGIKIGERVSGEGHIVCGICRNCRAGTRHLCIHTQGLGVNIAGAFQEFMALPATNVFPVPSAISDDIASILDPLGNAVHSALSFDLTCEDVLVTGAGPVGIMAASVACQVGAKNVVITDLNPYRLDLAHQLGISHCININHSSIKDFMKGGPGMVEGFDVALEMSGSLSAFSEILEYMRPGGKIALLGLLPKGDISLEPVIFKGLKIKGIFGREMYETWYKMSSLLLNGLDIEKIITHRFPVTEFKEAFEIMRKGESGKIILDWEGV